MRGYETAERRELFFYKSIKFKIKFATLMFDFNIRFVLYISKSYLYNYFNKQHSNDYIS